MEPGGEFGSPDGFANFGCTDCFEAGHGVVSQLRRSALNESGRPTLMIFGLLIVAAPKPAEDFAPTPRVNMSLMAEARMAASDRISAVSSVTVSHGQ